jgi:hypothetical protein
VAVARKKLKAERACSSANGTSGIGRAASVKDALKEPVTRKEILEDQHQPARPHHLYVRAIHGGAEATLTDAPLLYDRDVIKVPIKANDPWAARAI